MDMNITVKELNDYLQGVEGCADYIGPWIVGAVKCTLCGYVDWVVCPWNGYEVNEYNCECESCGQMEMKFMVAECQE